MRSALTKGLLWIAVMSGVASTGILAQDPVKVGPDIYNCIFENERVRVCEATFKPGAKIGTHSHPDHVVYALTAGKVRITSADGPHDVELKPGQVTWIKAESHSAVNVGTTEVRLLVTELKEPAK